MLNTFEVNKVLIIAPLRVARDTWPAEIEKWDHLKGLDISVIVGDVKTRIAAVHHPAMIYIVNRENIKWLVEYYEKNGMRWDFSMVVIDELSSFKNYQSQRFKFLRKVRPFVKRWVGLTGTPSSNGLMDLWAEIGILDGGERLGKFIGRYREAYFKASSMNPSTGVVFQYKPREGAEELIYQRISDITISMKALDYLHMPDCIPSRYEVEMSAPERELYDMLRKDLLIPLKDGDIDAANAASLTGKLLQIVDERGNRQFRTAYVEIGKKNGKSELAAAVALYLLFADNEPSAEVYGAAADRQQASIVFDVAHQMVQMTPALLKRCKIMAATKRIVNYGNAGFYQVLSAEVGTKHGLNVSGLVLDEVHAQPNRKLYDVLTKGSGDAREQPLFFLITTAGTDKESICYELHMKALDLLAGRKIDHTFYPVVYGLTDEDDWHDEANWYKANPSLGQTIQIQRVRDAYQEALDNPAEENVFKQLRLNMWVSSLTRFIPEHIYNLGNQPIDLEALKGRDCYGGLDLSSTGDITAFVLMFPPRTPEEKYIMLPFFWIPEDTIPQRVRRASVPYDVWYQQGYLMATEGNVIHYGFIEKVIEELGKTYHILEIAFDRWGAVQMTQNLEGMGFTVVPFGQGFKDMSPPTKEFYKLLMEGRIIHGGNPVMAWMAGNVVVDTDPAGNIKPTKAKSPEKIDGIVAAIMALDRCIRNEGQQQGSVYDERDMIVF